MPLRYDAQGNPIYDNQYLRDQQPAPASSEQWTDVMKSPAEQARLRQVSAMLMPSGGQDAILNDAKSWLASPQAQIAPTDQDRAYAASASQDQRSTTRKITSSLSDAGTGASWLSIPATFMGGGAAGGALAGLGGLLRVPDELRRAYAPDADESQPGVGEALGTGADLAFGALGGGLGRLAAGPTEREIGELGRVSHTFAEDARQGTEVPYRAEPGSVSYTGVPDPPNLSRTPDFADVQERVAPSNIDRTRTYGDLNERVTNGGVRPDPPNLDRTRTYGNAREAMTNGGVQMAQPPSMQALISQLNNESRLGLRTVPGVSPELQAMAARAREFGTLPAQEPDAWHALADLSSRHEGPMVGADSPLVAASKRAAAMAHVPAPTLVSPHAAAEAALPASWQALVDMAREKAAAPALDATEHDLTAFTRDTSKAAHARAVARSPNSRLTEQF